MLSIRDLDIHPASEAHQLTGTGVRHHGDRELRRAARHGAAVLEDEGAGAAMQRSADPLDGNVTGRALRDGAAGEHLAFARTFEIAVKLFVDRHSAEHRAFGALVSRKRLQRHFERSPCMSGHDRSLRNRGLYTSRVKAEGQAYCRNFQSVAFPYRDDSACLPNALRRKLVTR